MKLARIKNGNSQTLTLPNGDVVLISYSTPVGAFISGQGFFRTSEKFSSTTSKHINQWLKSEQALGREQVRPQSFFDNLVKVN